MKYSESLKKNKDFQIVYKNGKSLANHYLVMYLLPNELNKNRLGISVSKKSGKQRGKASSYTSDKRELSNVRRAFPSWI